MDDPHAPGSPLIWLYLGILTFVLPLVIMTIVFKISKRNKFE